MENLEMVERLADKTGVAYSEARDALEATNWNLLDAVIELEKQGKIEKRSGSYVTGNADNVADNTSSVKEAYAQKKEEKKSKIKGIFAKLKAFFINNKMHVRDNNGKEIISFPIIVAFVLLLVAFWVVIIVILISLVAGFHYSFEGPELGNDKVNKTADDIGNIVKDLGQDIKDKYNKNKEK